MSQVTTDPWKPVAEDSFGAASELSQQHWRSSVSRAYYAAYSLVSGCLRQNGLVMPGSKEGPSHAKLPELVETNLTVLRVKDRPRLASRLRDLYKLRILADYWPSVDLVEADVRSALYLMGDVFRWLKEKSDGQAGR